MEWIVKHKKWFEITGWILFAVGVIWAWRAGLFTDTEKLQALLEKKRNIGTSSVCDRTGSTGCYSDHAGCHWMCVWSCVLRSVLGFRIQLYRNLYRFRLCIFIGKKVRNDVCTEYDRFKVL